MYRVSRKKFAKMTEPSKAPTTFAPATVRTRKMWNGINGSWTFRSLTRNDTRSAPDPISRRIVLALAPALPNDPRRQREHERSNRNVDEEDPLPPQVLRQHAAGEHADGGAAAAERTPDPERLVPVRALLEARHHDRERRRRDDRAAESLHAAGGDQHPLRLGEPAHEGGEREERDADDEDAPAAEQVGRPAAEEQEAAERDRVGGDHPLQVLAREVERAPDGG